ncbi:MAG: transporter substrate-binding domain-containing protein [Francisellaceae bacterium]|nr:transporter substrate-binding domain-containing protein [Francisellaceae bacterium]MBT6207479.1 transporter substrate-binding domain-containing protein [Francisellaceae bacterium]MBT6539240.1 transporter substrate-binding domain-containing protein [Francisellaceae bacterium]
MKSSLLKSSQRLSTIILLSLAPALLHANVTDDVKYYTENLPPYNFANDEDIATGFNTDVLLLMFKKMDNNLTANDIKVVPWARGYKMIQSTSKSAALYSTTRKASRENLFKWVGPLSSMENALIVLKGNPYNVKAPSDDGVYAKGFKYGAIRDDSGLSVLLENGGLTLDDVQVVSEYNQLIKLIMAKRIHAFSYNKYVSLYNIEQMGLNTDDFEIIYAKKLGDHYIAFSQGTPNEVVEQHQKAFDEVMQDKSAINEIMNKYK